MMTTAITDNDDPIKTQLRLPFLRINVVLLPNSNDLKAAERPGDRCFSRQTSYSEWNFFFFYSVPSGQRIEYFEIKHLIVDYNRMEEKTFAGHYQQCSFIAHSQQSESLDVPTSVLQSSRESCRF